MAGISKFTRSLLRLWELKFDSPRRGPRKLRRESSLLSRYTLTGRLGKLDRGRCGTSSQSCRAADRLPKIHHSCRNGRPGRRLDEQLGHVKFGKTARRPESSGARAAATVGPGSE